ncbi:MAG: family metallopeptidase [Thermoleophilia bacterium]|nr:family metallopeptidase [Thermoleophilia bacterium]
MARQRTGESGGTSILALGIILGAAFLIVILGAVGRAYVAHAELQQAADVAARTMVVAGGDDPRSRAIALARENGARRVEIEPDGSELHVRVWASAPRVLGVRAGTQIMAESWIDQPPPALAGDGGPNPPGQYAGPLVYVDGGVPICPRVGAAYRVMQADARRDGVTISATSGFRTYAEQAILYAQLGPAIAAPPGVSRHHDATEFDLKVGPAGSSVHRWLTAHGPAHGFVQRYSWEPWHWGFVAGC